MELSTTLAAAAIVMTLGVPTFRGLHSDMHSSQVRSDLIASFALARSEAIRRGVAVTVCPSADGSTCATATSGDWSRGWIVVTPDSQIIEVSHFDRPAFSLATDHSMAAGVSFSSLGSPSATGTLTYSDDVGTCTLRLIPIGRLETIPGASRCQ